MGQIILYVAASLDGFIADADGGVDWLSQEDENDYGYYEFYAEVEALAMGRRTYDQVLGFGEWPYPGKTTYVFTSHPPAEGPAGVSFVETSPVDFAQSVAADCSGTVWLVGGGNLVEQFRQEQLIDEYRVFVIPIILGEGRPLSEGAGGHTHLSLAATRVYDSGVVELRYHPDAK